MKKRKSFCKMLATGMAAAILTVSQVSAEVQSVNLGEVYEISTNHIENWPKGPEITSDTGIVMDGDTGVILYEKGADNLRYPASITKLMTLLVAVENASLEDEVTFTETCLRDVAPDSANIGMVPGEVVRMEECLYAMILASANEVSTQIAEFVGGTETQFIEMMNERARQLGCENTRFINANGLPGEGQYTTAHDMALIFQAVLQNETALNIMKTLSHTMPPTNKNPEKRGFSSHHPMVFPELKEYYYEGCLGGKTGNTNDAGSTLVSFAERDGRTYIVVVLRAVGLPQSCFDTAALFDYAYDQFETVKVEGNGNVTLPKGVPLENLTTEDVQEEGEAVRKYYYQGRYMGSAPIPEEPEETELSLEEVGDADQEPLYRTEASDKAPAGEEGAGGQANDSQSLQEESGEEHHGISSLSRKLLLVMAAMIVVLIRLMIALVLKKRR